jgi:1-aminocyclopropane-1-carboxylate synthase
MSGLSVRGERFQKAGAVRLRFAEIWDDANIYHATENPTGMINMGTAENYVMMSDVSDFVNTQVVGPVNSSIQILTRLQVNFVGADVDYGAGPWGSERIRKAMSNHMNNYFNPLKPVDPEHLLFATGCTSICNMLGHSLFEPGEGLLLSRPIYQAFQTDFGLQAESVLDCGSTKIPG